MQKLIDLHGHGVAYRLLVAPVAGVWGLGGHGEEGKRERRRRGIRFRAYPWRRLTMAIGISPGRCTSGSVLCMQTWESWIGEGREPQGSAAALAWVPVSCSAAALRAGGEQGGLGALPPDDDILFVVRQTGLGGGGDLIGDVRHRETSSWWSACKAKGTQGLPASGRWGRRSVGAVPGGV